MSQYSELEIENLRKQMESLQERLELERKKMNDAEFLDITKKLENIVTLNFKCRRQLKGHIGKVLCVDWSDDRHHLVSSSQDGKLIVWDAFTTNKEHAFTMPTTWVLSCAYSPSGRLVACGGLDNKCSVFPLSIESDVVSIKKRTIASHTSYMSSCVFCHRDAQLLTASGDGICALWDVENATMIQSFADSQVVHGHIADVLSVDIDPESSNTFVSGGCDRQALVWDLRTGRSSFSFQNHEGDVNCVRFFPSGDAFATGRLLFAGYNDYTIQVWDTLKCCRVSSIYGHENRVSYIKMSPDGSALGSCSWDTTIKIWA